MKHVLFALVVLLSFIPGCIPYQTAPYGSPTYRTRASEPLESVVSIYSVRIDEPIKFDIRGNMLHQEHVFAGTAFAVDEDHLLTAGHICVAIDMLSQKASKSFVPLFIAYQMNDRGELANSFVAEIEYFQDDAVDDDVDVCILKAEKHGLRPLPIAGESTSLLYGDKVSVVGAPHGLFPITVTAEFVSSGSLAFKGPGGWTLTFHGHVQPGNSGSPVIDKHGRVVGIVSSLSLVADNVFFVVSPEGIHSFYTDLKRFRRGKTLDASSKEEDGRDLQCR
jgi:S1-C subfamily serine protease